MAFQRIVAPGSQGRFDKSQLLLGDLGKRLDQCEDVIGGLREAMQLEWQGKTRILYLISDWPPHGKRFTTDAMNTKFEQQLACENLRFLTCILGDDCFIPECLNAF